MKKKGVPRRLWDLGLMYESKLLTRMAMGHSRRSGYEEVTGNTPDISQWLDFEFYDLVLWWNGSEKLNVSDDPKHLGRWV
eukprot:2000056-Ditylum_brightwellii.AAC.1